MIKRLIKMFKKKNLFGFILFIISVFILSVLIWLSKSFGSVPFEQYVFHMKVPLDGTDTGVIFQCIKESLIVMVIIVVLIHIPLMQLNNNQPELSIKFKNKEFKFNVFPFTKFKNNYFKLSMIVFVGVLCFASFDVGIVAYAKKQLQTTQLFEEHYVDPVDVSINFPEDKKNLVLIFLESMENTYSSKENGGVFDNDLVPELTEIAKNNINFSHSDTLGGALDIYGVGYTMSGMVAATAGIPIKVPIYGNSYGEKEDFFPNLINLGDILEKEGYNQTLMVGTNANFSGKGKYFKQHGNYNIVDYFTAKEKKYIDEDYEVFWGYEDRKLFEFAKTEILEIAEKSEPFNFTMLTVDTHFPGYYDESCPNSNSYESVLTCSSSMLSEFLNWIKEQSFYEDTTIVLLGDHLNFDGSIFPNIDKSYQRSIYNTFINSSEIPDNSNNRTFTTFDMFPTILSSIGAKIEGDRLGLGTNLFSDKKTLPEEIGLGYLDSELSKTSKFYNDKFLYNK